MNRECKYFTDVEQRNRHYFSCDIDMDLTFCGSKCAYRTNKQIEERRKTNKPVLGRIKEGKIVKIRRVNREQ